MQDYNGLGSRRWLDEIDLRGAAQDAAEPAPLLHRQRMTEKHRTDFRAAERKPEMP